MHHCTAGVLCILIAVSLDELRQATCQDDFSQHASSHSTCALEDSDSELSLPHQKVHHTSNYQ